MVTISYDARFEKKIRKIKDEMIKLKMKKQIMKAIDNPEIGKPMKYTRKSTRELYIAPFRLSYMYLKEEDKIIFLDLCQKLSTKVLSM